MVKSIKMLIGAAAALSALFACTKAEFKEEVNPSAKGKYSIYVSAEDPEMKVALNDKAFSWHTGDAIAVVDYKTGDYYKFVAQEDGATNVRFETNEIDDPSGMDLWFAVYPYVQSDKLYYPGSSSKNGNYHQLRFEVPTVQTGLLEDAPHRLVCNTNRHSGKYVFQSGVAYWKFTVPAELKATRLVFRHEPVDSTASRFLAGGSQARITHKEGAEGEDLAYMAFSAADGWAKRSNEIEVYRGGELISGDIYLVICEMNDDGLAFTVRVETSDNKVAFLNLDGSRVMKAGTIQNGGTLNATKFYDTEVIECQFPNYSNTGGFTNLYDMAAYLQGSMNIRTAYQHSHKYLSFVPKANYYAFNLFGTKAIAYSAVAGVRTNSVNSSSLTFLEFPVVKGKRLVKAEVEFGQNNTSSDTLAQSGKAGIGNSRGELLKDGANNVIGTYLTNQYQRHASWDLYGAPGSMYQATHPDSTYRLMASTTSSMNIFKVRLTYVGEEQERIKSVVNYLPKNYVHKIQFQGRVRATSGFSLSQAKLGFDYKFGNGDWQTVAAGSYKAPAFTSPDVPINAYYDQPFLPVAVRAYALDTTNMKKVYAPIKEYVRILLNFQKDHGLTSITGLAAGASESRQFTLNNPYDGKTYNVSITCKNTSSEPVDALVVNKDGSGNNTNIVLSDKCEVTFRFPDMEKYGLSYFAVGFPDATNSTYTSNFTSYMYRTDGGTKKNYNKLIGLTTNSGKPGAGLNPFVGNFWHPTSQAASSFNGMPEDKNAGVEWVKAANTGADVTITMISLEYQ